MAFATSNRSIADVLRNMIAQVYPPCCARKPNWRASNCRRMSAGGRLGLGSLGGAVLLIPALVILLEAGVAALEFVQHLRPGGCRRADAGCS
jgi:hypothetical protein